MPITAEAQKVTGISWNRTEMTVKDLPVDSFSIVEALYKFYLQRYFDSSQWQSV